MYRLHLLQLAYNYYQVHAINIVQISVQIPICK